MPDIDPSLIEPLVDPLIDPPDLVAEGLVLSSSAELVVWDAVREPDGWISIVFKNRGLRAIGGGIFAHVYVDTVHQGSIDLDSALPASYRDPQQTTSLRTDIRVAKENYARRLGVHLTTRDGRPVSAFYSLFMRSLYVESDDPDTSRFRLALLDVVPDGPGAAVLIANVGPGRAPSVPRQIYMQVGTLQLGPFPFALPELGPGDVARVPLPVPRELPLDEPTWVDVRLVPNPRADRDLMTDTTRLHTRAIVPRRSLTAHRWLLTGLAREIIWRPEGHRSQHPYIDWTPAQKNDLEAKIERLYTGEADREIRRLPPPTVASPVFGQIAPSDAWDIFLEFVAISIWVDVERIVPWRIFDISNRAHRAALFDARFIIGYIDPRRDTVQLDSHRQGYVLPWCPWVGLRYLLDFGLVGPTATETVYRVTDWIRGRLNHFTGLATPENFERWFGYYGYPPLDRMMYAPPEDGPLTVGCYGTSGFYAAVLRTVNIPVTLQPRIPMGTHVRPDFVSLAITMSHGDNPYTIEYLPSCMGFESRTIPTEKLFVTSAAYQSDFLDARLDCNETVCNSRGQQVEVETRRMALRAALDTMPIPFLARVVMDLHTWALRSESDALRQAETLLSGAYARPFFVEREMRVFRRRIMDAIRRIGEGDYALGASRVRRAHIESAATSDPLVRTRPEYASAV